MTTKTRTLADLKPGDKVIYHYGYTQKEILTVDRITKTQIICSGNNRTGWRFRCKDGYAPGESGWCRSHIEVADKDSLQEIAKRKMAEKLARKPVADWNKLGIDSLRRILAILEKGRESE